METQMVGYIGELPTSGEDRARLQHRLERELAERRAHEQATALERKREIEAAHAKACAAWNQRTRDLNDPACRARAARQAAEKAERETAHNQRVRAAMIEAAALIEAARRGDGR